MCCQPSPLRAFRNSTRSFLSWSFRLRGLTSWCNPAGFLPEDVAQSGGFRDLVHFQGDFYGVGFSGLIVRMGIASSAMACPRPEKETEETYLSVYAEVDGWSIEDSELVLSADGDEVLRYAAATDR